MVLGPLDGKEQTEQKLFVLIIIVQRSRQMLTARAEGFAVILSILGMIGCLFKFDYNVVIGLGLVLLGTRHAYLNRLASFYFLIVTTVVVDIASILVLETQPFLTRFLLTVL